jgi:glutathionylspermidine synthase
MFISQLGWNGTHFLSPTGEPVKMLFKLYPWEWLLLEDADRKLLKADVVWVEPPWKAVLSNKGLLPILWELFPDHRNLLASFWTLEQATAKLGAHYVAKPLLGREGQNITIKSEQGEFSVPGIYTDNGYVYQQVCMPPKHGTRYCCFGGWVVGDKAAGLAIREDLTPIITNHSSFIPHVIFPPKDEKPEASK